MADDRSVEDLETELADEWAAFQENIARLEAWLRMNYPGLVPPGLPVVTWYDQDGNETRH